jgi:hypothetical protein
MAPDPTEVGWREARRKPTEQPTTRRCSADESVASMSSLPATWRSFLPWALSSPTRSRAIRTIPAMPEPVSLLRSSRSSALEGPCPRHRGKPWRRGPMESLRWFTRSFAAEAGGTNGRQRGPKPNPEAPRLFSGAGEPVAAPGSRAGRSRSGGSERCHRSLSGEHGREERVRNATRGVRHPRVEAFRGEPRGARHRPSWGLSTSKNAPRSVDRYAPAGPAWPGGCDPPSPTVLR